jgi:hypothetical protein
MNNVDTFSAVRACAVAILAGTVLQANNVSAGNGSVIDWRTVRCGETLQESGDAFDTAQLFVALVGPAAALDALQGEAVEPAPPVRIQPVVHAYMRQANGGRLRSFEAGGFKVMIEAHDDDDAQAAFAARLAAFCAESF